MQQRILCLSISSLLSMFFGFFLLASNSLYDVIICLVRSAESFANRDHNMIIFQKCNIFTKSVYLESNLCPHFSTALQSFLQIEDYFKANFNDT